jgi:hypothetical protein
MGLDLLDVAFRVEKTFGVPLASSDFEQLVRDRDIVVSDLYELILRRVHARDTVRNDVRLNFALWEELQQQLGEATGVPAWMSQKFPVLLVLRNSEGEVRWMEVRDYLNRESDSGRKTVKQIVFDGERFDVMSVRRWRAQVLGWGIP